MMCQKNGSLSFLKCEFRLLIWITVTATRHYPVTFLSTDFCCFLECIYTVWAIVLCKIFPFPLCSSKRWGDHAHLETVSWNNGISGAQFCFINAGLTISSIPLDFSTKLIPLSVCQVTLPSPSLQNKTKQKGMNKERIAANWEKSKIPLVGSLGNYLLFFALLQQFGQENIWMCRVS